MCQVKGHETEKITMSRDIGSPVTFSKLPYEVQIGILQLLSEDDLRSMYKASNALKLLVREYKSDKYNITESEWRWYCRHTPKKIECLTCLRRFRKNYNVRCKDDAWDWWLH